MRRAFCISLFTLLAATACGGDTAPIPASFSGSWSLQRVNGAALPFVQSTNNSARIEILDEQLLVSATGTFTETGHERVTYTSGSSVQTVPYTYSGAYSLSGNTAAFVFAGGTTGSATIAGGKLTIVLRSNTYVYGSP